MGSFLALSVVNDLTIPCEVEIRFKVCWCIFVVANIPSKKNWEKKWKMKKSLVCHSWSFCDVYLYLSDLKYFFFFNFFTKKKVHRSGTLRPRESLKCKAFPKLPRRSSATSSSSAHSYRSGSQKSKLKPPSLNEVVVWVSRKVVQNDNEHEDMSHCHVRITVILACCISIYISIKCVLPGHESFVVGREI